MVKRLDNKFVPRSVSRRWLRSANEIEPDATQEELLSTLKSAYINLDEQNYVLSVSTEAFDPKYAFELE